MLFQHKINEATNYNRDTFTYSDMTQLAHRVSMKFLLRRHFCVSSFTSFHCFSTVPVSSRIESLHVSFSRSRFIFPLGFQSSCLSKPFLGWYGCYFLDFASMMQHSYFIVPKQLQLMLSRDLCQTPFVGQATECFPSISFPELYITVSPTFFWNNATKLAKHFYFINIITINSKYVFGGGKFGFAVLIMNPT